MINKELIYLWREYLQGAKEINATNVKQFQRCVSILYKVNVCGTCSQTINTYYTMMKKWIDAQIVKDENFLSYGEAPIELQPLAKQEVKPTLENREPKSKEEVQIEDIANLEEGTHDTVLGKIKVTKNKKKK